MIKTAQKSYNRGLRMIYINENQMMKKDSIQEVIDRCTEEGGKIVIPKGEWKTGPIHLKSNIHLHLSEGAVLIFSEKFEDYLPVVFTRWEGMECYNYSPLIYAKDCENISVTGNGTLIGNGEYWWKWKEMQKKAAEELCYAQLNNVPVEERVYGTVEAALRPSFIQTVNCKNVFLEGFTIKDGPQWTIHPVYCENVVIKDVTVLTHGPNTDGLNPDSCSNVLIDGCTFETGDDCIAINSGMNEDGKRVNIPCRNIEIKNCTMNGGHGGVVIGSAVSGGVENIYAHNCKISKTMQGIRLKSMRGRGGYINNAVFENIIIDDVTDQAIQINMFYEYSTVQPKSNDITVCSNIEIKNVCGKGAKTAVKISGLPEEKLKDISLENIYLEAENGIECSNVKKLSLKNVELKEN